MRSASWAQAPSTSSAPASTSSTLPTGRQSGVRTVRCSARTVLRRRCSSSPECSIRPGRSRSRQTRFCPSETFRSRGAVRRRRPLGAGGREQDRPPPVHAPRGARRRLLDRRRARSRPARAPHGREPPRRGAQRPAPDRARLRRVGALRRLYRARRSLAPGISGAGVRPRSRFDLAHRRRQPRRLPRLRDRGQPGRRAAARTRPRRPAGHPLDGGERPDRQRHLPRARLRLVRAALLRRPARGQDRFVRRDRNPARRARPTLSSCKQRGYRHGMTDSLIPPSITGKGSQFPPGGSVLDHAFGASDPYTLGVEEEYMLLDDETFDLVQHIDTVLAAVAGHELDPRVNPELMQAVVVAATPVCRAAADYAQVVNQLERTGCIQDYTHIWWDIRLHPRLGTVEIRICDAVTRLEDVIAITAYCQALVKHYAELVERGEVIPSFHRILTTENKWLAARYGLSAPVMDLHSGRRNRLPVAALVRRTLETLRPHARDLGSENELAGVEEILRRGNGADRQLHVFNANRDIVEVAREIAEATEVAAEPEPAAA